MLTIVCENVYIIVLLYCMKYLMLSVSSQLGCPHVDVHAAIILSNQDKSSSLPFLYFVTLKTGQTSRDEFHLKPNKILLDQAWQCGRKVLCCSALKPHS